MRNTRLWSIVLTLILVPAVRAQFENAAVLGAISDATNAVIPGASVSLTNVNTGIERIASTDESGNYQFLNVAIGQYQVRAEQTGFKVAVSEILPLRSATRPKPSK